jgi:hypothetical protein
MVGLASIEGGMVSGELNHLDEPLGESGGGVPDAFPLIADSKPSMLPFNGLPWEKFEGLVLETVQAVEDVVEIRPYGLRGEQQHSIDVIARKSTGEWRAIQAKLVKSFRLADLRGIVDPFIAGPRPFDATHLVIVTACAGVSTKVQEAIYEYGRTHPGLEFEQVWDGGELSRRLRRLPRIVARYFGEATAQRFCDEDALLEVKTRPGRLVSEVQDPFVLEVHEAISPSGVALPIPQLPVYVPRRHDGDLEKVVNRALSGESGLAVLLGNSSTGKTRSAWEQVKRLPEEWRLWHPTSSDELLAKLPEIVPNTVLWLNELHRYLYTDDPRRDETTAAQVLDLLRDPCRAPVLIFGTLWHEYRLRLAPAESNNDLRPQVRTLVSGHFIPVQETFTDAELRLLAATAEQDPRLAEAQTKAEQGHITQYLAGGPAQIERYLSADPAAQSVLHAAMDARRLGWDLSLPAAFLADAAQAYLTELQQDNLPDDWFDRAVDYLLPLCRGARGPLSRVRTGASATSHANYRLVDYLEQYGKRTRSQLCPPDGFWLAALRDEVAVGDMAALAQAAYHRDRTDIARRLARAAAARGDASGVAAFAALIDRDEGREAALPYFRLAAENGDADSQVALGFWHEGGGEWDTAEAWYARADDGQNPDALVGLASLQSHRGQPEKAEQLYDQALAVGGARSVEYQARYLAAQGQHDLALYLAERSFEHGNLEALTGLAWTYISTDKSRAFAVMEHAMKLGALCETLTRTLLTCGDARQRPSSA